MFAMNVRRLDQCEETSKGGHPQDTSRNDQYRRMTFLSRCLTILSCSHRNLVLHKEKEQERDEHEQSVQRLSAKHEMDMSHLNQEHALSAAKVSLNVFAHNRIIAAHSAFPH